MSKSMTMSEAVKRAVEADDACLAGLVADGLRFKFGLRYEEVYAFAQRHTEVSRADWDALMARADEEAG